MVPSGCGEGIVQPKVSRNVLAGLESTYMAVMLVTVSLHDVACVDLGETKSHPMRAWFHIHSFPRDNEALA